MPFHLSDIVAVVASLIAAAAYVRARRVAARLRALNEAFWELRYQYGELKAAVTRDGPKTAPPEGPTAPPRPPADGFIPLESLKR